MVRKENKVKRAFFHHNDFQRKMQNYVLYFFLDILMKTDEKSKDFYIQNEP